MTAMEAAKKLTQEAIDKGIAEEAPKPWASKWYFDWTVEDSGQEITIRSGCCGADSEAEAVAMIRWSCWAEYHDAETNLRLTKTGLTWPRIVS